ncbi:MAG: tetratricopeptide repeat protein [Nevskiaceae bacterium]|nr:MAG: tetratricopeptide repeat protein [Nevskiaceae bacterium]TBR73602.1 MAG: tetratricopeptide repeat protein [Nevskiaceae bacterium]
MPHAPSFTLVAAALVPALALSACAVYHAQSAPTTANVPQPQALDTPRAQAAYHVLLGTLAAHRGDNSIAVRELLAANAIVPDRMLVTEAAAAALTLNDPATGLKAVQALVDQEPDDPRANAALLDLAIRANAPDTAFRAALKLLEVSPDGIPGGYRDVADVLSQTNTLKQETLAAETMRRLVAEHPDMAEAHYAAGLLALRQYDSDTAVAAAKQAVKLDGSDPGARLLLVAAHVEAGQLPAAQRALAPLISASPSERQTDLRMAYAQFLFKYGRYAATRQALATILRAAPGDEKALLMLARTELLTNQSQDALKTLDHIHSVPPARMAEIEFYRGRAAEQLRDYPAALEHYDHCRGSALEAPARVRQAVVLGAQGKLEEARMTLHALAAALPDQASDAVSAESALLLNAGRTHEALAVVATALEATPGDEDLLYQQALVQDRLGNTRQAVATLHRLITAHPHEVRYLNGLGFTLAEHGASATLDQAQQLITEALRMAPEDPSVLDSMGWVLYRRGKAAQALPYLTQAYALFNDPEVAAHLVTVLTATGDHRAAGQMLARALQRDPTDAQLLKLKSQLAP